MSAPPLQIFYPLGGTSACQMYIYQAGIPVPWDGSVSVSVSSSGSAIQDGVSTTIKATVTNYLAGASVPAHANPLSVMLVDTTGVPYNASGGGTQNVLVVNTTGTAVPVVLQAASAVIGHVIVDSGSITANAGTNLNTSALALEAGHLSTIDAATVSSALVLGTTGGTKVITDAAGTIQQYLRGLITQLITPGSILVSLYNNKTIKSVSGSLTADTDIITAVTSKRIKVIGYAFFTFGTSANVVLLKSNGTGGTLLWTVALQSVTSQVFGANLAVSAPSFIFATVAGEKLTADVNNSDTIYYSISYFDDDAS